MPTAITRLFNGSQFKKGTCLNPARVGLREVPGAATAVFSDGKFERK